VWYQNIGSASFSFVTIHASDRWTDRIAIAISWVALHAYCQHAYQHVGITNTPIHDYCGEV